MLRKTGRHGPVDRRCRAASMRPQRNAAENGVGRRSALSAGAASMRPQRNAAENDLIPCNGNGGVLLQ